MQRYDKLMCESWAKAVEFNDKYKVGTFVEVVGKGVEVIVQPATVLGNGDIVVQLNGQSPVRTDCVSGAAASPVGY